MLPLTIVHTESHRQWGGQEIRIFNECAWMHRRGHRVIIIAPRASCLYRRSVEQGWQTHAVAFRDAGLPVDMLRLRWLLKEIRPDVFNTHGNIDSKAGLAAAWGLGIPCVIRSRHHSPPVRPSWYNRLLYRRLCHVVFTTGDVITRQLVADLDAGSRRVITLTSGIAAPSGLPDREAARRALAAELDLSETTRFIGCISLLDPGKGQTVLIDAFEHLAPDFPHHLVFIGDGAYGRELRQHVPPEIAGRVHFPGFREDPWPCFRAMDCHVLASTRHEGTPQVILQAMFAGCPVVATRTGGIPGVVEHEVTGLLAEPGNAASLAGAIEHTLRNAEETSRRVAQARQYVRAHHTMDVMGEKTLAVYRQVMSGRIEPAGQGISS
jgi:glycosyltransferase involved in cell wall biosynthesis